LKKILFLFFSFFAALGLALVATSVQAHGPGTLAVGFTSNPRFPVAGQPAEFTFTPVYNDGSPNTLLVPMVMIAWTASGGHTHGEQAVDATPAAGSMAGMNMGTTAPSGGVPAEIMLMPLETTPGVYVSNVTFEQGGRYIATFSNGEDEFDIVVGVRSGSVAWWYIGVLAGVVIVLAAAVAVTKTARRTW
jgi:hypothetical protein